MYKQKLLSKTLLIIEDNLKVSKHLCEILEVYCKKVLLAFDGCEAVQIIESKIPDVIISDIKMACLDGISVIKKIENENYKPVVIITTAFSDTEYLLEAVNLKVDGYLIKPIQIEELLEKIDHALNSYENINLRYKMLSQREYEVMLLLAKGLKPQAIAEIFGIKAKTISTYRMRIFEKMDFKTNAELVSYVIKNDLN